jgi:hypothetical protein
VAWNHDYSQLPVGRCAWIKLQAGTIKAKTVYPARPEDMQGPFFPDQVWARVKDGFLNGKSIGFVALEESAPTKKEIETRPELDGVKRIIRKGTLFEYSVCAIPCNPSALAEQIAKSILDVPDWMQEQLGLKALENLVESCIIWGAADYLETEKKTIPLPLYSRDVEAVKTQVLELMRKKKYAK